MTATVDYDLWLCRSSDMSQITQLNIHNRQLQQQLNSSGKLTGWVHLLDDGVEEVIPHQTALRVDREGQTIWSGAIWQANENSAASSGTEEGQDQLQFTAFGWFNALGSSTNIGRLVHTGAEFSNPGPPPGEQLGMLELPNGVAWQVANGAYVPLGIDTAIQLAYDAVEFPQTTDAAIIFDLLNRANIDSPTRITPGVIYGNPIQRNLTLQRFQNIGQEITQLCNVEAGVDFYVDPVTRKMDLYGPESGTSMIAHGLGQDRGPGCLFSYPGNCTSAQRTGDGTQTENRVIAVGQYGVGRADDIGSQSLNDLHEVQASLSEVVDPNILVAYAQAEIAVKSNPWTIVTFTPRPIMPGEKNPGVPRPFVDFNIGDIVYVRIDRGKRFQVGTAGNPQPVRIFGMTITIDDDGIERCSQVQTTYQGTSSG